MVDHRTKNVILYADCKMKIALNTYQSLFHLVEYLENLFNYFTKKGRIPINLSLKLYKATTNQKVIYIGLYVKGFPFSFLQ